MRHFISLLLFIVGGFTALSGQSAYNYNETLIKSTYNTDYQINVYDKDDELTRLISSVFVPKNSEARLISKLSSLAGYHYSFQVAINGIPIHGAMIRAHVTRQGEVYKINTLLPAHVSFNQLIDAEVKPNLSSMPKGCKVILQHPVFVPVGNQQLKEAVLIQFEERLNDIYKERIYYSDSEYWEKDRRSFSDTTLHGKVFLPDPLTTAEASYNLPYEDGVIVDTSLIILERAINPNSAFAFSGASIVYKGQTLFFNPEIIPSSLTGDSVYVVIETINTDGGEVSSTTIALIDDVNSAVTTLNKADYDHPALLAEETWVTTIGDYGGAMFRLRNSFFVISDFSFPVVLPVTSPADTFEFPRSAPGFEDFNTFYHLNEMREYIRSLGFTNLDRQRLSVDTHGNSGGDNSFYSHSESYDTVSTNPLVLDTINISNILVFGEGGVDDAEDADVVIHEYGHFLSFLAAPFTNVGAERQGLDEGFGDYLAASYSRSLSEYGWQDVFTWDGHNEFWNGRLADTDKTAQDIDLAQSIYYQGEIWSSVLMDLWSVLGRETTDALAIQTMYFNAAQGTLQEAADNLLLSDSLLFNGDHKCEINEVLRNRLFSNKVCFDGEFVAGNGLSVVNSFGFADNSSPVTFVVAEGGFTEMDVSVYDLNGKLLLQELAINQPSYLLSSETFDRGVYVVRLRTNNNRYETKLLKLK